MHFNFLILLTALCPVGLLAEWKKEVILQFPAGRELINGVVAHDFGGNGKIEVMASFQGGVTLFGGKNWEIKREVARFRDVYSGNRKMKSSFIHVLMIAYLNKFLSFIVICIIRFKIPII